MKKLSHFLMLGIACLGCTESISISPEYTDDTSWQPAIAITGNNYHRVEVLIQSPPPLPVMRNLTHLRLEVRQAGDIGFAPVVTRDLQYSILWNDRLRSPANLSQQTEYDVRVTALYRGGVERQSAVISILAPEVKGEVRRRIPWPEMPDCDECPPTALAFANDRFYALGHFGGILTLSPATSDSELLIPEILPDQHRLRNNSYDLAVHQQMALLLKDNQPDARTLSLHFFDLATRRFGREMLLDLPSGAFGGKLVAYNGEAIYLVWYFDQQQHFVKIGAQNGQLLNTWPRFDFPVSSVLDYAHDGTAFWIGQHQHFDNRVARFAAESGQFLPAERNPVFDCRYLIWDGTAFWVFDLEAFALAQIRLQGL